MSSSSLDTLTRCRACNVIVKVKYTMKTDTGNQVTYFFCQCGTVFHNEPLNKKMYDPEYVGLRRKEKYFQEKLDLVRRVYMPMIENHSLGRECLEIGFGFPENIVDMRKRGWLADGIDLVPNDYTTGDFEATDFKGAHFDFILISHTLKCFEDPIKALRKAVSLLKTGGLLMLMEPDTNLCMAYGYGNFGHWGHESRTMFSMERMILECVRAGMEPKPLLSICNVDRHFLHTNDYHIIMRKAMR